MKTEELTGRLLDYWVDRAEGTPPDVLDSFHKAEILTPYSTDWAHGGPIIAREHIELHDNRENEFVEDGLFYNGPWLATYADERDGCGGDTPLIAAMRAYVARKFGEEVPDEPPTL